MYSISDLQQVLDTAIRAYQYPQQPKELYEPVSYLLGLGGKRLRPALLLMATDLFGGNVKNAVNPALAIEFFHNFTLMHDDIMDKAPLRRGNPTVHTKWNDAVAILSGDIMLIESYKLLMNVPADILPKVLNVFNITATGVCEGQQIDMNFEQQSEVQITEYINMIRLKTAVLLGGALQIGALIANASADDLQNIYSFGENIGIAFQLQDDILDVYGNPENFGKQVGGDILSNKKTYLLIKALELAKGKIKVDLDNLLSDKDFDASEKVHKVTDIYNQLNIRKLAQEAMMSYAEKGIQALNNIKVPDERRQVLKDFVNKLTVRIN